MSWTPDQALAIESRGSSVLVSAAAGSGKTSVLTERLLRYVTDPDSPSDIDDFLVITYTRAAAAELRSRILAVLTEQASKQPQNPHLRRQQSLCCRAQIGTIHSFCTELLRQYSQPLGISPAFTVLDEDRSAQMKQKLASRLLDKHYESADSDPSFRLLADTVGAGRDDRLLEKALLDLYEKLLSHPYPEDWAAEQADAFALDGITDPGQTVWGAALLRSAADRAGFLAGALDAAAAEIQCADAKIQKAYGEPFAEAAALYRDIRRAAEQGWMRTGEFIRTPYPKLGRLVKYDNPELQTRVKAVWDHARDAYKDLCLLFSEDPDAQLGNLRTAAPAMKALLDLTLEFRQLYTAEKKRRETLDFSDLEHCAVALLVNRETEAPTPIARELSAKYTEIMVDEYQDVNEMQEMIFHAVSREKRNLFLVGDVKQSIYRFRLAEPHLFLEKYRSFAPSETAQPGEPRRILLRENFRSRKPVLTAVNRVFSNIMSEGLGELDYDDNAALRYGSVKYDPSLDAVPEFHIIDPEGFDEDSPAGDELEAHLIARRILDLVRCGCPVTDGDGTRPCRWDDFVLLLRSPGKRAQIYQRVLAEAGIPVQSQQGDGFFSSLEVSVLLDLLTVIDNPHSDVSLISVLRSPAFRFTVDELSGIRAADRERKLDFYSALCLAAENGNERCSAFLRQLKNWRELAPELGLEALVWRLCSETGLFAVCTAMPDGEARRQNLMHLFEYARSFGDSGSRGVYRFVQWLRRLEAAGRAPETVSVGECVRILSIHKSKGLEFPFVFLCGLGHRFNLSDRSERVLLHTKLGLGPKCVDPVLGIEYPTLARRAVAEQILNEQLSEEIRVLYVGMTRAKERLFLYSVRKNAREHLEDLLPFRTEPVSPEFLKKYSTYADWIFLASGFDGNVIQTTVHDSAEDLSAEPAAAEPETEMGREDLLRKLRERLDFVYPWAGAEDLPSKLTATELKAPEPEEAAEDARFHAPEPPLRFRRPEPGRPGKVSATERGTITHRFLQYLRFDCADSEARLRAEADRMVASEYLRAEDPASIDFASVQRLFASPLGQRMRSATELHREFRFLLLSDADSFYDGASPEDQILLQGVVDCCFVENGSIIVVDYKTDRIRAEEVPQRAEHYRGQLRAYASSLERIFGLPVKECVLWFLHPGTDCEVLL